MAEGFSVVTYALCNKQTQKAISEAIEGLADGMRFKGSVATKADLPLIARKGDLYIVEEDKSKVVFSGGVWVEFDHELELIAGTGIEITPTLDGGLEISNTGTSFTAIVDVVNTYADLLAYDISKLKDNDIIEVLSDINHDNTVSYYKLKPVVDSEGNINIDPFNDDPSENWQYVTSQQPTYTKVEADNKFLTEVAADNKYLTGIEAGEGIDVTLNSEGVPVISTEPLSSNVVDVVNTYTDLQNYDITNLKENDIIEVLEDSEHNNSISFYKYNGEVSTPTYLSYDTPSIISLENGSNFVKIDKDGRFVVVINGSSFQLWGIFLGSSRRCEANSYSACEESTAYTNNSNFTIDSIQYSDFGYLSRNLSYLSLYSNYPQVNKIDGKSGRDTAFAYTYGDLHIDPVATWNYITSQGPFTTFDDFSAGTGISINTNSEGKLEISNTQTSAAWGNITGTLDDQLDLATALNEKQDTLTPGNGISIVENSAGELEISTDLVVPTGVSTTTVNSITDVGTLPTLIFTPDAVTGNLTIAWSQGTLPTKGADTTVATGLSYDPQEVWTGGNY